MFRRPTIFLAEGSERIGRFLRSRFNIASTSDEKPDIVLLDVSMSLIDAIDAATRIREWAPSARIVFVAVGDDAKPLNLGTLGFVLRVRSLSDLPDAIWTLIGDEEVQPTQLTTREREVIQLLAQGKLMKQVADELNLSTRTVAFHKYGVMRKLGLRSSAELVRLAVSEGLVA